MVGEHYLLASPGCIKESHSLLLFFFFLPLFYPFWNVIVVVSGIVEFMTHRTYADCWTCITAMQFNKRAHILGIFNYI